MPSMLLRDDGSLVVPAFDEPLLDDQRSHRLPAQGREGLPREHSSRARLKTRDSDRLEIVQVAVV